MYSVIIITLTISNCFVVTTLSYLGISFKASISFSSSRKGSRHQMRSGRCSSVGILGLCEKFRSYTHGYLVTQICTVLTYMGAQS